MRWALDWWPAWAPREALPISRNRKRHGLQGQCGSGPEAVPSCGQVHSELRLKSDSSTLQVKRGL